MALPKIEEARGLSDEELVEAIVETKRELFQLRFQKATRQLEKEVHKFKHTRHWLAQLMTVQRERQLASSQVADEVSETVAVADASSETDEI